MTRPERRRRAGLQASEARPAPRADKSEQAAQQPLASDVGIGSGAAPPRGLLERLNEVAVSVQRARDEDAIFAVAADALQSEGLLPVILELVDPTTISVRQVRLPASSPASARMDELGTGAFIYPLSHMPDVAQAIRDRRPFYQPDVVASMRHAFQAESFERQLVAELGMRQAVVVPLLVEGAARGALVVLAADLSSADAAAIAVFGSQVSGALETAELIKNLHKKNRELAAINAIAQASSELPPNELLAYALDRLLPVADADAGVVWLRKGEQLEIVSARGDPHSAPHGLTIRIGEWVAGRAAALGTTCQADRTDPERGAAMAASGLEIVIALPLMSQGLVIGVLSLARTRPVRFGAADQAILASVAAQLGVALENARLHERVRRRMEELSLVNAVAQAGMRLDLVRLFADTLQRSCAALGFDLGLVYRLEGAVLELASSYGVSLAPGAPAHVSIDDPLVAEIVREGRPRVIALENVDLDHRRFAVAEGLRVAVALPLIVQERLVGGLFLARRRDEPPAADEVRLLSSIGVQLAVTSEVVRLIADLEAKNRHLAAVNEVGRAVGASLDLDELMGATFAHLQELVSLDGAALYLVDRERKVFEVAAHRGASERLFKAVHRLPIDEQRLGRLLEDGRARVFGEADYDARDWAFLSSEGIGALAMLPVVVGGQTIGIFVGWHRRAEPISSNSLELLSAISAQLGLSVQNARLFAAARSKVDELSLLNSIGRAVAESLELEEIVRTAAPRLAQLVDVANCFIILVDERQELFSGAAFVPSDAPEPRAFSVPYQKATLARVVVESNQVISMEHAEDDPRASSELRARYRHKAMLAVPLSLGGVAIGVVLLGETRGPRRFTADEVQRAVSTANQISVAIANARLFEKTRGLYSDLKVSYARLAETQEQLVKRERLAALGELSAVVAHEVRNPLGVIFNSLGSLQRLRPQGDAPVLLRIIGEEAARLNRMVGDLLDFARPMEPTLQPEALDHLVEDALRSVAQAENAPAVRVEVDLGGVSGVRMDARLMRQALVNVMLNGYQAMPKGGVLRVATREAALEGKRMATVEIADTGSGMAPAVQGRIFQPFFTTKASGAGLGLAVVKQIVDAHGGAIVVHSEPGAGTRFTIGLPAGAAE